MTWINSIMAKITISTNRYYYYFNNFNFTKYNLFQWNCYNVYKHSVCRKFLLDEWFWDFRGILVQRCIGQWCLGIPSCQHDNINSKTDPRDQLAPQWPASVTTTSHIRIIDNNVSSAAQHITPSIAITFCSISHLQFSINPRCSSALLTNSLL